MTYLLYFILVLIGIIYGFFFGKFQVFPYAQLLKIFKKLRENTRPKELQLEAYSDVSDRVEISCTHLNKSKTMVILAFGQAHAANSAEILYVPKQKSVYNIFNSKCYEAKDPLLGATATNEYKGSVWTRLADKVIEEGLYESVVIKTVAVAGTSIASWTTEGKGYGWGKQYHGNYHQRVLNAYTELKALELEPTHICWVQGESDTTNKTTTLEYKKRFLNIRESLRKVGMTAPIYIAISSRDDKTFRLGEDVLTAQKELIDECEDLYEGPNLNSIDSIDDRLIPYINLTSQGVEKHAEAWLSILKRSERK